MMTVQSLVRHLRPVAAACTSVFVALAMFAPVRAAGDAALRAKILGAFAKVSSYKVTVLGSVRSTGVWVAPDRYHMTTQIEGKPLETVIVGKAYWTKSNGKWERSGTTSSNLDVDIAGLARAAKTTPASAFTMQPGTMQDGKPVGTFAFAFPDGTDETCNYDLTTFLVTRCKAEEVTLLYSDFNDPKNTVPKV